MAIDSNLFYIALFFAFMLASALAYLIFKQRKQNKAAEKKTAGPELIPHTVPEVRRLLVAIAWFRLREPVFALDWSRWRRRHQAYARRCHYRTRGHPLRS